MRPKHGGSVVYMATNAVDGATYIGITGAYFSRRKAAHRRCALKDNSTTHFHRAIRKYGWENFSFEILSYWDSHDHAKAEEVRLIAALAPRYNMTKGGDGALGYKHTPEVVEEIRRRNTGRPGFWKGKKLPPHIGRLSAERNRNRADSKRVLAMGPKSQRKRVICVDDGRVFESVTAAAEYYGLNNTQVSAVCCRRPLRVTAGGKIFRFVDDASGVVDARVVREESWNRRFRPGQPRATKSVVCVKDGKVYASVKAAAETYGLRPAQVINSCRGRYKRKCWEKVSFAYATDLQGEAR